MKTIAPKPYIILWLLIPISLLLMIGVNEYAFDIMIHDTDIANSKPLVQLLISILLLIEGYLYWLCRKLNFDRLLIITHVILTTLTVLFISTQGYYREILISSSGKMPEALVEVSIVLFLVIIQVIFMIKAIYTIVIKSK